MNTTFNYVRELWTSAIRGWDKFWFTPTDPAVLAMIRILGGAMLLYTHFIWTKDFDAFFGPQDPWLSASAVQAFQTGAVAPTGSPRGTGDTTPVGPIAAGRQPGLPEAARNDTLAAAVPGPVAQGPEMIEAVPAVPADDRLAPAGESEPRQPWRTFAWSWFKWTDSRTALWALHFLSLAAFACLLVGFKTRLAAIVAFLATVSYVNRVPGALFGLDQVNGMLAMYLAVGPCGAAWSLDRWLAARRAGHALAVVPSAGANISIRLIQLHMCVIYFFAGIGKLQGVSWWDGTAMWQAFANLEYQSLDMTWMSGWPRVINLMTHVTVFWEIAFWALVWPRLTRPLMLLIAIPLHLGIAICLGMPTFGLAMLIGCASFLSPAFVRGFVGWFRGLLPLKAGQPQAAPA
ncbi:MAG: HTTM domain-containing protein [Pirellulales bacterium]